MFTILLLKSYRSFKHFSEQEFLKDLQGFNFNNISKLEDIDEAYSNFENSIIKTLDKHAPISFWYNKLDFLLN
jgi:hypothetical protein